MSLIHDALRKAAEDQARREGRPLPPRRAELEPLPERRRSAAGFAVLGFCLVAAIAAIYSWWPAAPPALHTQNSPALPTALPIAATPQVEKPAPQSENQFGENRPAESPAVAAKIAPPEPAPRLEREVVAPPSAESASAEADSSKAASSEAASSPVPRDPGIPAPAAEPVPATVAPTTLAPTTVAPSTTEAPTTAPTTVRPTPEAPTVAAAPASTTTVAPKLIQTPSQVGQVGENTFVLRAEVDGQKLELDFIVWGAEPFAQVNGRQVAVGQQVDGYLVTAISRDQITLEKPERRLVLRIR